MNIRKISSNRLAAALLLSAVLVTLAVPAAAQNSNRYGNGYGGANGTRPGSGLATSTQPLTADEIKSLLFMREEEKLARDVYLKLYAKWNLTLFKNIATSEERHSTAVGNLLAAYNVMDPGKSYPAGAYASAELNAMYAQLIAKGMTSVKDALEVGVLIEKTDIEDLESALKLTSKLDIKRVYTNLLEGSFNHLEAFESNQEVLCPVCAQN